MKPDSLTFLATAGKQQSRLCPSRHQAAPSSIRVAASSGGGGRRNWLPEDNQVVKLKYFSGVDPIAAHVSLSEKSVARFALIQGEPSRKPTLRKDRKHQSAFRQEILANYAHRCCITSERVVELLEAAHIQPYIDERSNHPQNGLCLRVDLHRLFDEGLISVTSRNTVAVSDHLAGTSYAGLEGATVSLPVDVLVKPSPEALGFHRTSVFRSRMVVRSKPQARTERQPTTLPLPLPPPPHLS
jgi:hypothetical protein